MTDAVVSKINIKLLFFGQIKDLFVGHSEVISIEEGSSVETVVDRLASEAGKGRIKELPLLYAINETFEPKTTVLKENDCLAIMTPVAGG